MKNPGMYYKYRSKKYFQKKGYTVTLSEFIFRTGKFFRKVDIFGSDIIAMKKDEIIFINSKFVSNKKREYNAKSEGLKEFSLYPFPPFVKAQLAIWYKRAKDPIIVEYDTINSPILDGK